MLRKVINEHGNEATPHAEPPYGMGGAAGTVMMIKTRPGQDPAAMCISTGRADTKSHGAQRVADSIN